MAAADDLTGRATELSASRVSLALFLALIVTIFGLHVVIQGGLWWLQLCLLAAVLLGVAAIIRRLSRYRSDTRTQRFLPVLAALAVHLVTLTLFFAPTTAFLALVPTPTTFGAFSDLFGAALQSINQQSVPALVNPALLFILCLGVGLVAIAAEALANSCRAPALSGVPLLILLAVPSVVSIESTDPIVFVLAAVSYLLILRTASARRQTRLSIVLAAGVLAATLVVPLVVPATGTAVVTSRGMSTGVNPVLILGNDLRQDIDHEVLRYSTKSGDATYLRLATVDNFSGRDWSPNIYRIDRTNQPEHIDSPPGLAADVARTKDETTVTVSDLMSPWVPVPYPASAVTGLTGDWYWNADNQSLASPNITSQNQSYTATHLRVAPTPEQLAAAGATVPPSYARYLALPANMPGNIKETAISVAGQASTNYDKALLLQNFFRLSDFSYSETAPVDHGYDGTGMQVVSRFLTEKSGYCIHFASAMAVMARTLGIPSRVDIGFLPGTGVERGIDGRATFEVTSHDLHAWPELYFEGIGWTRFEPTVSRGDLPAYADPQAADVPVPLNQPDAGVTASASASAAPVPLASASPGTINADSQSRQASTSAPALIVPALLVLAILALLAPALLRLRRRTARLTAVRRGRAPITVAWQEIRDTAKDLGVPAADTATPQEFASTLMSMPGLAPAVAAISRLQVSVEQHSFARTAVDTDVKNTEVRHADVKNTDVKNTDVKNTDVKNTDVTRAAVDAAVVIAGLHASVSRAHRLRALLAPTTGWAFLPGWLGARR